jgi:hypothetical protein
MLVAPEAIPAATPLPSERGRLTTILPPVNQCAVKRSVISAIAMANKLRLATFSATKPSPIPTSCAGTRICRSGRDQVDGRQ